MDRLIMNKRIIIEQPSITGNLSSNILHDVTEVALINSCIIPSATSPMDVIRCIFNNKPPYNIGHFTTRSQRDQAFKVINQTNKAWIVLDYNEYFGVPLLPDSLMDNLLPSKYTIEKALNYALTTIGTDISTTDAFSGLHKKVLQDITTRKELNHFLEPSLAQIWAKTLKAPYRYTYGVGVAKVQFFTYLISRHNEKL